MKIINFIINIFKKIWFFIEATFVIILEKIFGPKTQTKNINPKDLTGAYKNIKAIESDISSSSTPENLELCLKKLYMFLEEIDTIKDIPYLNYNKKKNSKLKYDVVKLEEYIKKVIIVVTQKLDESKIIKTKEEKEEIEKTELEKKEELKNDPFNINNSENHLQDNIDEISAENIDNNLSNDINFNDLNGESVILYGANKVALEEVTINKIKANAKKGFTKETVDLQDIKLAMDLIKNSINKEENINLRMSAIKSSTTSKISYSYTLWTRIKQTFRNIFRIPRFKNKHIRSLTSTALLNNSLIGTRRSINKTVVVKYITTQDISYYLTDTWNIVGKNLDLCYDAKQQISHLKSEVKDYFSKDISNMEEVKNIYKELEKIDQRLDKKTKELSGIRESLNKKHVNSKTKVLKQYRYEKGI